MLELIYVVETKCVKCKKCMKVCPMSVISENEEGFPKPTEDAFKLCINCGYCIDICVYDALFHKVRRQRSVSSRAALKRYNALIKKEKGEENEK